MVIQKKKSGRHRSMILQHVNNQHMYKQTFCSKLFQPNKRLRLQQTPRLIQPSIIKQLSTDTFFQFNLLKISRNKNLLKVLLQFSFCLVQTDLLSAFVIFFAVRRLPYIFFWFFFVKYWSSNKNRLYWNRTFLIPICLPIRF